MASEEHTPSSAEQQVGASAQDAVHPPPQQHDEIYSRLRTQVEFYFSPQNLSRDTYLRNMLTIEQHTDMPTPRPMQFMCPVGIITNFPKVKAICAQFPTEEPVALLLGKALDGSHIVTTDGNWIGPVNQTLPPSIIMTNSIMGGPGGQMAMGGMMGAGPMGPMGQQLPRAPHPSFQPHPYQMQQGYTMPNYPMHQGMMGMNLPPPQPPMQQQGNMGEQQPGGMPYVVGGPNVGSDSPSSASVESFPSQQQQLQQPQQNQQHETQQKLDASASSRVTSGASLSSMSGPGAGQQTLTGQHAYPLPPPVGGPSPPPPSSALPPPMQGMLPPGPGQPPYPMAPYYNPQQMYPHMGYMQQQGQGGPQQPQMQMMPQPYPGQMGYGPGIPPPMPPQQYPANGPPPPYPMQAMQQQYMDSGPPQQFGYPPPQQHQQRQFHDNRRVGSPGFHHNNDHHHNQHHGNKNRSRGGGGGGKNKKKNNNNHQQHGQPQRRGSYGSGSTETDNNGQQQRFNQNYFRHDHSRSPPFGQHQQHHQGGGGGNNNKSNNINWKKGSDQQPQQFRRSNSGSSPNRHNMHQNTHHGDRLSGSGTSSSSRLQNKSDEADREIFTSSDFPGLVGEGSEGKSDKPTTQKQQGDKKPNSNLVGYASALLKKKEEEKSSGDSTATASESKNDDSNAVEATKSIETAGDNEVDTLTRQTEEMEREILSEFHDLSLIGNKDASSSSSQNRNDKSAGLSSDGKTEETLSGTASSSTRNSLPILPAAGPYETEDTATETLTYSASEQTESASSPTKAKKSEQLIDIRNAQDFPSRDMNSSVDNASPPPSNNAEEEQPADKPKTPVVWGSKSFAEVIKD